MPANTRCKIYWSIVILFSGLEALNIIEWCSIPPALGMSYHFVLIFLILMETGGFPGAFEVGDAMGSRMGRIWTSIINSGMGIHTSIINSTTRIQTWIINSTNRIRTSTTMTKIQTMKYHHLLSILRLTTAILFNLTLPCLLLSPHQFSKISLLALLSSAHLEISIYASLLISISLVEFAFAIADSSIFIAPRSGWATLAAGGGLLQRLRYLTTTLTFPPSLLLFLLTLALYASLFPLMERERVLDEFFARPFLIGVGKITVLVLLLGAVVLVVLGAVEPGVKVVQWGLRGLEGGMGRMKERGFWKG